jgi:phage terminase large subunit
VTLAETTIHLNRFKPRAYQLPIFDALENKEYRRVLAILPRRAGKDVCGFNLAMRASLRKVGVYYYIFPTYAQGKKVIWDSITNEGYRFLDYIPKELVKSLNSQEMKITLTNGSIIQIVGSDNYDSLMGTNPRGVIFSEYSLQDPRAYMYIRPILTANDGWALFLSTPRGKNHLWEIYQIAQNSPEWFCLKLTIEDTQHIPLSEIEKERAEGIMSEDLIQQEYYTSFTMGVEGSYYAKYLDRMRVKGQICTVPYETGFPVHTAWDIGTRDSTCIIFFQQVGAVVRFIDCYEKNKEGLEHYIKIVNQKEYIYGKHFAPHDIAVQEWGLGMTRIEKARELGLKFTMAPKHSIEDGIEAVRTSFSKIWIDSQNCAPLIKALENYRQEFDAKRKVYRDSPLHDWSSHFADSVRYLCVSLPKLQDGLTPDKLDQIRREAWYGDKKQLPTVFQDEGNQGWY